MNTKRQALEEKIREVIKWSHNIGGVEERHVSITGKKILDQASNKLISLFIQFAREIVPEKKPCPHKAYSSSHMQELGFDDCIDEIQSTLSELEEGKI